MKVVFWFPVIWEILGESNDPLFIILKSLVNKDGLHSNKRYKQTIRGIRLMAKPAGWVQSIASTVEVCSSEPPLKHLQLDTITQDRKSLDSNESVVTAIEAEPREIQSKSITKRCRPKRYRVEENGPDTKRKHLKTTNDKILTRSVRPSTCPPDNSFCWVKMEHYSALPAFISNDKKFVQTVTTAGELCQRKFANFEILKEDFVKPPNFVRGLRLFNKNYNKSFI